MFYLAIKLSLSQHGKSIVCEFIVIILLVRSIVAGQYYYSYAAFPELDFLPLFEYSISPLQYYVKYTHY